MALRLSALARTDARDRGGPVPLLQEAGLDLSQLGRGDFGDQGFGIRSSAAASDPKRVTGLAAIVNDSGDGTTRVVTALDGESVDVNTILIKYTYNGDGDFSGTLTADDYARIDIGFASRSTTDYYSGDFNYTDTTNFDDFFIIDKAYAGQSQPLSAPAAPAEAVRTRRAARRQHHHVRRKPAREPIWLMFPHRR